MKASSESRSNNLVTMLDKINVREKMITSVSLKTCMKTTKGNPYKNTESFLT